MTLRWAQALSTKLAKSIGAPIATKTNSTLGSDDYFELYMLARVLHVSPATTVQNLNAAGEYVVTASPSPAWVGVSYLRTPRSIVRTGVEVRCTDGECAEIDLGVFASAAVALAVGSGSAIESKDLGAALECKDHERRASRTLAHEVLGKTIRLRMRVGGFGIASYGGTPDVALVARSGVTSSARAVLKAWNVECLEASSAAVAAQNIDPWLRHRV